MRHRSYTDEETFIIISEYKKGADETQIAKLIHRKHKSVADKIKRLKEEKRLT